MKAMRSFPGSAPTSSQVGTRRRRRQVRVADVRAARRVEQRGAVADGARERVVDDEPAHDVADVRARADCGPASASGRRGRSRRRECGSSRRRRCRGAIATMPDATAAAVPPLDPPELCSVFQGLRVGPKACGSVVGRMPNSGVFVLPRMTRPARLVARDQLAVVVGHVVLEEGGAPGHRARRRRKP